MIKGRQCANTGTKDGHWMGVPAQALEESRHLLMHHRVARDPVVEILLLRRSRQIPIEQKIASFEKVAVFGDLFNRVTAVEQYAFVAVNISDVRFAARRRRKAGIISEHPGRSVKLANIDHRWPNRSLLDGHGDGDIANTKGAGRRAHSR